MIARLKAFLVSFLDKSGDWPYIDFQAMCCGISNVYIFERREM